MKHNILNETFTLMSFTQNASLLMTLEWYLFSATSNIMKTVNDIFVYKLVSSLLTYSPLHLKYSHLFEVTMLVTPD